MNKDEIKKALECCSNPSINYCKDCPYNKNGEFSCCNDVMCKDTLDLIIKQENEIDRLKIQLEQANTRIVNCSGCEFVETNGIKEFAEKLKDLLYTVYGKHGAPLGDLTAEDIACEIDELLKEYKQ